MRSDQPVVHLLGIVGMQPEGHPEAGPRMGVVEVDPGQRLAEGERSGARVEDDGAGRAGTAAKAEPALVEGCGAIEVAHLLGDEVGAGDGHWDLLVAMSVP